MTTVITVRSRDRAALLADPSFVYVGRRCAGWLASPWGNPFKGPEAVSRFAEWLGRNEKLLSRLPELKGKTLGCWCGTWKPGEPEIPCHAVVLAKLADEGFGQSE